MDRNTPNYIVEEECKIEKMRIKAIRRALRFEEKARESSKKIVKECIKEKDRDRERVNIGRGSRKRLEILKDEKIVDTRGMSGTEFKEEVREKVIKGRKEKNKANNLEKIERSSYNKVYKDIITEQAASYLKNHMNIKDRRVLARFRCGNEFKVKDHWKEIESIKCRLCKREEEDVLHVFGRCKETKSDKAIEEILSQEAKEIEYLRKINRIRRGKELENFQDQTKY